MQITIDQPQIDKDFEEIPDAARSYLAWSKPPANPTSNPSCALEDRAFAASTASTASSTHPPNGNPEPHAPHPHVPRPPRRRSRQRRQIPRPRTPQGKARSSQNGLTWGFSAARRRMPTLWHNHAAQLAETISSHSSDPILRSLIARVVYLAVWRRYLRALYVNLYTHIFDACAQDPLRTAHTLVTQTPALSSYHRAAARIDRLSSQAERLVLLRQRHLATIENEHTNPYLADSSSAPKAFAANSTLPPQPSPRFQVHREGPQPVPSLIVPRFDRFQSRLPQPPRQPLPLPSPSVPLPQPLRHPLQHPSPAQVQPRQMIQLPIGHIRDRRRLQCDHRRKPSHPAPKSPFPITRRITSASARHGDRKSSPDGS